MRVNRQQLADILGITKPTISAWIDDGLPWVEQGSKGKEWVFETKEVIAWYAECKHKERDGRARAQKVKDNPFTKPDMGNIGETIEEANLRKEAALADKHELAAAKEAGMLVPIDEVEAIVVEEHTRVRTRILALPNELRPLLLTHLKNDRKAVEACVRKAEETIHEALEEIRTYAGEGDDEDRDG